MTSKDRHVKQVLVNKAEARRSLLEEAERLMARPDAITDEGVMLEFKTMGEKLRGSDFETLYIDSLGHLESNRGYVPNMHHPRRLFEDAFRARQKQKIKMKNRLKRKRNKQQKRKKK